MDLTWLDEEDLRRWFGTPTLERARDYVRRGSVLEQRAQVDDGSGELEVRGVVAGSRSKPYDVAVTAGVDRDGLWTRSRCTCPVHTDCKHAVALLLAARGASGAGPEAGGAWRRRLAAALEELEDASAAADPLRPLGLQVELQRVTGAARGSVRERASAPGQLRLRPVHQGVRGWVRSGISWQDVPYLAQRGYARTQAEVLGELLAAYRAAQRAWYGSESHLTLSAFGPSLWRLLEQAADSGLELVAGQGLEEVSVHRAPVMLAVDVASDDKGARVRVGARCGDRWFPGPDVEVLGAAGHGVALWRPGSAGGRWAVTLAPLSQPAGPRLRRLLGAEEDLLVPAEARDDLVADVLPRLQRHLPVSSSDGSLRLPEPAEPRLVLTVRWSAVDEVAVAWSFRYRVGGDDREYGIAEQRGMRGVRRPLAEQALLEELALDEEQAHRLCAGRSRALGLVPEQTFRGVHAIAFAQDVLPLLEARGQVEIEEIGIRPDYREASGAPVVRFAARDRGERAASLPEARTDWLDLEVVVSVDGHFLPLSRLLEAMTRGEPRVILPSGVHVPVDRPELARLAELVRAAAELEEQPPDAVRVGHHDLGLWDELAEIGVVDAQADQWVRAAQALRGMEGLPEVEPVGLDAELRHYQAEGFRWLAFLWESRLGGILADDMGLGKTLQTLALLAHARARGAAPFLVVAPTSVVSTWAHEAERFAPGLVVRTVTESRSRRGASVESLLDGTDVLVTSYTLLRLEADAYVGLSWGGLVLDEAQAVKNHQGRTYQAVRRLDVPFRLALTGTPMENRLMELWSLLSIVAPGLYPHPQRFAELVANPVEKEGDQAVLARFRRRIRPFLLRRTKELVASDLPPKQEQVLEVQLTSRHRRVYETHLQRERQQVLGLVGDFDRHRIAILRSLTRLRQLSLDPALVDEAYAGIGSAKVDVLVDHLQELVAEGHRALVFSQFTSFLTRVRARLDAEGIEAAYLDGRTRRRAEVVGAFKDGRAPVFLISLKAGGVGLTLTEADYVFVLDPWWNPAVEAQAVDRTHRIGQDRPVMVYRLVSAGTIEEKVVELKQRKAALFAEVLEGAGGMGAPLDAADVRALLEA